MRNGQGVGVAQGEAGQRPIPPRPGAKPAGQGKDEAVHRDDAHRAVAGVGDEHIAYRIPAHRHRMAQPRPVGLIPIPAVLRPACPS